MPREPQLEFGPNKRVAAVRKPEHLPAALGVGWPVVFLLIGDLFTAEDYVARAF